MTTDVREYTTIRIRRDTKERLDSITPKNMSYSDRLDKMYQETINNDLIADYLKAVKETANYVDLDDFNKQMEKEFGKLE